MNVNSYRLIGYEDRLLPPAAFANDSIDAGDLSAGHRVTAIYEIVPYGEPERATYSSALQTQELRYAQKNELHSIELLELSIRYKLPQEDSSRLKQQVLPAASQQFSQTSNDHQWACTFAECCLLLRQSNFLGESSFEQAIGRAYAAADDIPERLEFINLMRSAQKIYSQKTSP